MKSQQGMALLLMTVLILTSAAALLLHSLNHLNASSQRQAVTARALAQAKAALIGYAVTYSDTHPGEVPGYLPCPDIDGSNGEGSSPLNCGAKNISQLGHFPWKSLKLPPLRDGYNECLWYAVSGTYKNTPQTDLMNWDTNGQFQMYAADGVTRLDSADDAVIAVILAPGMTLAGQARSGVDSNKCGTHYTAASFLEGDAAHNLNNAEVSAGRFVQGNYPLNGVNDQLLFITRQELWTAIRQRADFNLALTQLMQRVAECLADYGNNNVDSRNLSLPWPAEMVPATPDYGQNSKYNDTKNLYVGRVPYDVGTSSSASNHKIKSKGTLMTNNGLQCPHYAANPGSDALAWAYPWWNNWKDHLFYAISKAYKPVNSPTLPCVSDCLKVNGTGDFAAMVLFADSPLPGVMRASQTSNNAERGVISLYLEGRNAGNFTVADGQSDFELATPNDTFNDQLYCIREISSRLSAVPCH